MLAHAVPIIICNPMRPALMKNQLEDLPSIPNPFSKNLTSRKTAINNDSLLINSVRDGASTIMLMNEETIMMGGGGEGDRDGSDLKHF